MLFPQDRVLAFPKWRAVASFDLDDPDGELGGGSRFQLPPESYFPKLDEIASHLLRSSALGRLLILFRFSSMLWGVLRR